MQGHAFMGNMKTTEQEYGYGFRGRMDERYDMVRSVVGETLHLHPQLHAPQIIRSACVLHVQDSNHTGLEETFR